MAEYVEREDIFNKKVEVPLFGKMVEMVAVSEIQRIPATDVRPVVHGKNIGKDYNEVDQFVCSECGVELQEWLRVERDEDTGEVTYYEYCFNFCPNCGADMRQEPT